MQICRHKSVRVFRVRKGLCRRRLLHASLRAGSTGTSVEDRADGMSLRGPREHALALLRAASPPSLESGTFTRPYNRRLGVWLRRPSRLHCSDHRSSLVAKGASDPFRLAGDPVWWPLRRQGGPCRVEWPSTLLPAVQRSLVECARGDSLSFFRGPDH